MEPYLNTLRKYFVFEGRTGLREFWMFVLINLIISAVLGALLPPVAAIYGLAVLLPSLGAGVRRLHDVGRSGWLALVVLIPVVGWIILLVLCVQKGTAGENKFGAAPAA